MLELQGLFDSSTECDGVATWVSHCDCRLELGVDMARSSSADAGPLDSTGEGCEGLSDAGSSSSDCV